MPWCPNCKAEYQAGYETCSDCNVALVEELPISPGEETASFDNEAFLTTVTDDIQANVLESLLEAHHIPVLKKYKGSGGYLEIYMGATYFGIDIYVPSSLMEKAKEIMEGEPQVIEIGNGPDEKAFQEEGKRFQRKRMVRVWGILLIFIVPMLALLVYSIIRAVT